MQLFYVITKKKKNLFPPVVFVHDLSSCLFLIRFCWAAPVAERGRFCLWLILPLLTIIKKNDTNVGSESTSVWRDQCEGRPRPPSQSEVLSLPAGAHVQEP